MACQLCICAAAFVAIMLLCWCTSTTSKEVPEKAEVAEIKNKSIDDREWRLIDASRSQEIKPPIIGKPFGEYPKMEATRFEERKYLELPRGGLSCPNKGWYDSIYNGGSETLLDMNSGNSKNDAKHHWDEDIIQTRRETRVPLAITSKPEGRLS